MPRRFVGFALVVALTAHLLAASASADDHEALDVGPFGPFAGYAFDPLAAHDPDDVPEVQQPDWWTAPVFNAYFGSALRPSGEGIDSVAVGADPAGAARVFVSTARTNRVYVYDAVAPAQPIASFGGGSGPGALSDAAGVAYWRGEVFVVDRSRARPENARVVVYDGDGTYRRSFPLLNPAGIADMTGIDVAAGEVWVTGAVCGGFGGVVEIFDALTGAIKGITVNAAHAPTGDPAHPCDTSWDASAWWDLATVPELDAAVAQYRLVKRGIVAALTTPDPELTCYTCFRRLWQDGIDAVWGMRWLLAVDGDSRTARGTGVTEYSFEPTAVTGDPFLRERRRWLPKQSTTGGIRDIAYLNRDTRIDWDGPLTTDDWLRTTQCLSYVVSDADIYAVGDQGEHWYEQARDFERIELRIDGALTATKTTATGQFCIDTSQYSNGTHRIELKAYAGGRTVTVENPGARFDNEPPSGTLAGIGQYSRGSVSLTGTATDAHSGPKTWEVEVQPEGGTWRRICGPLTQPDPAGSYSCDWNTANGQYPDGRYNLRAQVFDQSSGNGNIGYAPVISTFVDNTDPTLSVAGGLRDRASAGQPIFEDERPPIEVASTDTGGSGVARIEVFVDGLKVDGAEQACEGCALSRDFSLDPTRHETGDHTIRVVATDQAGRTREMSWTTEIWRNPPDVVDESDTDQFDPEGADTAGASAAPGAGVIPNVTGPDIVQTQGGSAIGELPGLECDSDDPYVVLDHLDYPTPESLDLVVGAPNPDLAVVGYLTSAANLPPIPPGIFNEEITTDLERFYSVHIDGDRRAWILLARTETGGWRGHYFGACSELVDGYFWASNLITEITP